MARNSASGACVTGVMRFAAFLLSLLFAASTARADTLADVLATLSRFVGKQPIRASYAIVSNSTTSGRFANNQGSSEIAVEVSRSVNGVSVTIPLALLERASDETRAHSGSFRNEMRNGIARVSPLEAAEGLNFAPSLTGILRMGRTTDERRESRDGRLVRRLILQITQPMTKNEGIEIGEAKTSEDRMTLWIDDNNVPLAAHRTRKTHAGFLFFHGDAAEDDDWRFAPIGDSLVLARFEHSSSFSGMGQKGNGKSVHTMTVH
jgi:hypothetical protein